AGATAHFYDVPQAHLDEITPPVGLAENTAAVEIRGDSLGPFFNRWYVFYDDVRRPVTPDLIGQLCVVGLPDGRILIKQIQRGASEGLYSLYSATEKPIPDVPVEWAARVNVISRGADREWASGPQPGLEASATSPHFASASRICCAKFAARARTP